MDLKLTEHDCWKHQKTGWNSDILNFFSKRFTFGLYFAENRHFTSAMFYYVIVTSYVDRFSWLWYQWKEKTLPNTVVRNNFTLILSISKLQGGGNHHPPPPLGRRVTKRLRKTRVKLDLPYAFFLHPIFPICFYGFTTGALLKFTLTLCISVCDKICTM